MILAEARQLRENSGPKAIARQIFENFGDMFADEHMIDSKVERHVYHELIESGYMTKSSPNFDLLDEVMDAISHLAILSEAEGRYAGAIAKLKRILSGALDGLPRVLRSLLAPFVGSGEMPQGEALNQLQKWMAVEYSLDAEGLEEVFGTVEKAISGAQDLVSRLGEILTDDDLAPGIALLKSRDFKGFQGFLGTLTQNLFRKSELDGFTPEQIKKDLKSLIMKKMLKMEGISSSTKKMIMEMIRAETKGRENRTNHTLSESRSLSVILFR